MESPLVSVVVIAYNSGKYILDALESAKKQTYANIELIIADDSSADGTVSMCQKWLRVNSSRFVAAQILESTANRGIPANCNIGVSKARGKYVKILAADDLIYPDFVESCVKSFEVSPSPGMVYTNSIIIHERENRLIHEDSSNYRSGNIFDDIFMLKYWPKAPAICYRNDVLHEMGLFDESIWVEDYLMVLKIADKYDIRHVDRHLACYRLHGKNIGGESISLYYSQLKAVKRFSTYDRFPERKRDILSKIASGARLRDSFAVLKIALKEKTPVLIPRYARSWMERKKTTLLGW